ncbi:MAG: hypothetical protein Q9200_001827 [Gallowayella weberi]
MAPSQSGNPANHPQPGPHPSYIQIAKPYVFESRIQECMLAAGVTEARDEDIRLQAVAWIDNVRRAMHLPVRTYNTAAVYFLKYRLVHPDNTGFIDAAAAALFTACKIEDTLKKSRDILCAAHNEKLTANEQVTPDDPMFENHAKIIIGVERLMLEASGFDFRNRYPQRLVLKLAKIYKVDKATVGRTAYNMSLDLYRTFAPLKQTTPTMAIACVELAGRVLDEPIGEIESVNEYKKWNITRQEVMETLLDLLDLYTHHRPSTIVGQDHALEKFISIRIALNQEASAEKLPRFAQSNRKQAMSNGTATNGVKDKKDPKGLTSPRSIASPKDVLSPQPIGLTSVTGTPVQGKPGLKEGTVRFMLDPERARDEKHTVSEFFKMDEEEYEDSGMSMTIPVDQGTDVPSAQHSVDAEPHSYDPMGRSEYGAGLNKESDQGPNSDATEMNTGTRASKTPLPDQNLAFKAAIQASNEIPVGVRGGGLATEFYPDQENYPATAVAYLKPRVSTPVWNRTPKQPLADQERAFQAALQKSSGPSSGMKRGLTTQSGQNEGGQRKGVAAAAEPQRHAAQETQQQKSVKKKPKRNWLQTISEQPHYR